MAENNRNTLVCIKCQAEYPADTPMCPADQGQLVPADDPLIGSLFADKYEILSIVGIGGMSKVYKARHTLMKRIVAVKLLHEEATEDPAARLRFEREAQAASALSHPNVVTVHDFGVTSAGQAFFIMDCLEGKSLEALLEETGCLNLDYAIEIFTQACDGLEHAHRKGIIHRDIKPSNFVIVKQDDGTELVKLVDFGIAKIPATDKKSNQLTQTGETFGTPAYMSPEQGSAKPLDARSDLYSFGCSMYEALVGEPPLLGETYISTVVKHINEPPKPMAQVAPHLNIPAALEAVVLKCLEKNPEDRYASAAELKQALFDAAYQSGLKGLRVGAVPEPKVASSQANKSIAGIIPDSSASKGNRIKIALVSGILSVVVLCSAWFIFVDSGTAGDGGTIWQQIVWQAGISQAEELAKQQKYSDAQRVLQNCLIQADQFNDDSWRELTLNRLVEAADRNHDFATQKKANEMLVAISDTKVYNEYRMIMGMLDEWQKPSGEIIALEKQQRAYAFGDRIFKLSDELAKRSVEKQQQLLAKAIAAYDALDLERSVHNLKFRLALAESYRSQQKVPEVIQLLQGSVKLFSEKPKTSAETVVKVRTLLMLGQAEVIQTKTKPDLDAATVHVQQALAAAREMTPPDPKIVFECTNALDILRGLHHHRSKYNNAVPVDAGYKPAQ